MTCGAVRAAAFAGPPLLPSRLPRRLARGLPAAFALLAALPSPAPAQNTHILLVSGLGGEPKYTDAFHGWLSRFADAATERYGVPPERITYLGERPEIDPTRIRARSTAGNIRAALAEIVAAMAPEDDLFVLLAGHGTFRDGTARFNLPGPDLTPADMGELLAGLGDRRLTFVNTASASGAFVEALSGPNRTVIAATRSGRERNLTRFGLHFVDAFAGDGADVEKDARVSMLEAFGYAVREVEREYGDGNLLRTEHAVLDDNGDGEGSSEPDGIEADGAFARTVFLASVRSAGRGPEPTPELRALHREKAAIERRIADLRRMKRGMPRERYENELEELLVELAFKNREIRAAEGRRPPVSLRHSQPDARPIRLVGIARDTARLISVRETKASSSSCSTRCMGIVWRLEGFDRRE